MKIPIILFFLLIFSTTNAQQAFEICEGETTFTYGVGMDIPGTVDWFLNGNPNGSGFSTSITYSEPGDYQLVAVGYNDLGCPGTPVVYNISVTQCDPLLYWVSNTFTPDGDEFNHEWGPILTSGISIDGFELTVYNRWGNPVWQTHDSSVRWDGTHAGTLVPDGTYIWVMRFKILDGDGVKLITGHVNLVR